MRYKSCITCMWEWLQNSIKLGIADSYLEFLYLQAGRRELNLKPLEKIWAYETILNNSHLRIGEGVGKMPLETWEPPASHYPSFHPSLSYLHQDPAAHMLLSHIFIWYGSCTWSIFSIVSDTLRHTVWVYSSGLFSRFLKLGILPWKSLADCLHITLKWTHRKWSGCCSSRVISTARKADGSTDTVCTAY